MLLRRSFIQSIFIFLSASSSVINAGELYKWKDKNGVVHYSEKKPEHLQNVESVDIKGDRQFQPVPTLLGIKRPENLDSRHIVLLREEDFWQLEQPNKKIATYYFGGDCVSPSTASFQKMKDNHRLLFPRVSSLVDWVEEKIYKLNYAVSESRKRPLKNNVARHDNALVLKWKLVNIDYHLCLFNLRKYNKNKRIRMGFDPFKYSESDYNRRRATLTISWTLEDGLSGKVLYQTETSGSADFWVRDIHKYRLKTIKESLQNATNNLFAQENFISIVMGVPKTANSAPAAQKLKKLDGGLLNSITNVLSSNAQKKSEFARAISSVQPLKAMIMEYYLSQDSWPRDFSEMGLSQSQLRDPTYVQRFELDYNGTIVIWLDEKRFTKDAAILIQPNVKPGALQIRWSCKTNLDNSYYGSYCQGL